MTADFATDYFLGTKDFSEFQGSITYTQIMNNNPCPPINYPITVGSSGGGATTGEGSGISSGGGFTGGSGGAGSVTVSCNDCSRNFSSVRDFNNTPACRVFTYTIYVSLRIAPIPSLPVTNPCPEDTLPIAVAPVIIPNKTATRINNLLGNILTVNQFDWLSSVSNTTEADKIVTFLLENNTTEGKEFGLFAIDALDEKFHISSFNELLEIIVAEQEYRVRMSQNELAIFDNLDRNKQLKYLQSAFQAWNYAEINYKNSFYNGKGDAVRHSFWNALSTVRLGSILTKQLTDAHETRPLDPNYTNNYKENLMDLFNNKIGRELAYGSGKLYQLVEDAIANGDLRYLSHLTNGTQGKATNASELIPTNQ